MKRLSVRFVGGQMLFLFSLLSLAMWPRLAMAGGDSKAEAREHFSKGVAAFEDKRFGEAAEEFEAAYKLSPALVVLYNIGKVNVVLGRSVEAVDAFETYLKQGASAIKPERVREVQAEIQKQLARIGSVKVETSLAGAEIRLDGKLVGQSPLSQALRVTSGSHSIGVSLPGYIGQVRDIDIPARSDMIVDFQLALVVPVRAESSATPPPTPQPSATPSRDPTALPTTTVPDTTRPVSTTPAEHTLGAHEDERSVPASAWGWKRTTGLVLVLGGLATVTWGGIDAYLGSKNANNASAQLSMATASTPDKVWNQELASFNAGKHQNQDGWFIVGAGAALAVVGGTVLMIATSAPTSSAVSFTPWISRGASGASVMARW